MSGDTISALFFRILRLYFTIAFLFCNSDFYITLLPFFNSNCKFISENLYSDYFHRIVIFFVFEIKLRIAIQKLLYCHIKK